MTTDVRERARRRKAPASRATDEVIDVMGRATVEAVLRMSAEQVAGPKEQAGATRTASCTATGCRRGVWG